jgi:septal ring factor EnvC (AmiA/AmiB activator)
MDLKTLVEQAPYIAALVAIVIIFTRSMDKARTDQTQSESQRDQQWREFLAEQRSQTTAALGRLSAEITSVSTAVATVHSEQLRHDSWMRESVDRMKEQSRKNGKTVPRPND